MRSDGALCMVDLNMTVMKDADGMVTGTVITARDVTERKHMEQELEKTRRMESISSLAGGLANDFDSILTTILGDLALSQENMNEEEAVCATLMHAEQETLRAKDLIKQLTMFAGDNALVTKPVSVAAVLKEAGEKALEKSPVHCEYSIADTTWPVEIDEHQIGQVFMSLLINAAHAMPDGGAISIAADNCPVSEHETSSLAQGPYVRITVHDEGIGILNDYLKNIFSPYAEKGRKGNGLVLATAYAVIKKHKGLITVESEFGAGTTFVVYLPASRGTALKTIISR